MSGEETEQLELPQRFQHQGKWPNAGVLKAMGLALVCLPIATAVPLQLFLIDLGLLGIGAVIVLILFGIVLQEKAKRARSIADVTVDERGLIIERPGETREITWPELKWAERDQAGGTVYLKLFGPDTKPVDRVPHSIDRFETLCGLVEARLEERPIEQIADAVEQRLRVRMRCQLAFAVPLVLLGVAMIVMALALPPHELTRLNKHGVFGWGEVIEVYTEGETHRLKYRVVADDREGPIKDVAMELEAWEPLRREFADEVWPSVEVVYLADELDVSFAKGQVMPSGGNRLLTTYVKGGGAILMGLLLLGSALGCRNGREKFIRAFEQERAKRASAAEDDA